MPTTSINALPFPASTDAPNGPAQIQNLAAQLDTRLVPRFSNVAARDAAITAPVEGQVCHVAAQVSPALPPRLMVYSEGKWRLVGPSPLAVLTGAWTESAGQFSNNPAPLTSLVVPDPGFPYRLSVSATCELGATASGTRWDLWVRVTGSVNYNLDYTIPASELTTFQRVDSPIANVAMTGASTVFVEARRAYGTGLGNITALNRRLNVYRHAA